MKFTEYLEEENKTVADVARDLGLKHTVVLRWAKGICKPNESNIRLMHNYTGGKVTLTDWYNINPTDEKELNNANNIMEN